MDWIASALLVGHYGLLATLCIFGVHRLYITYQARHYRPPPLPEQTFEELPCVTVQLPLYNEQYVAQRLIDAVAQLDYPSHLLQIQVLDDSTDSTPELVAQRVEQYRKEGLWIEHIRREDRSGYKAGALGEALATAEGEFIAVFDADFLPKPDWLMNVIHYFHDPDVGLVQAQWAYLNRHDSLLTRLQGIMLDAHFGIEQSARYASGVFFNFNGTAGIWRRTAIDEAGGWQADTITEDLDLSYRAQLVGWEFVYLRNVQCLSELPADMNAFKNQQRRWSKGGAEVMMKLLSRIWRTKLPNRKETQIRSSLRTLRIKLEASLHLASNLTHLLILIDSAVFLIPAVVLRQDILPYPPIWVDLVLFTFGGLSHIYFYLTAQDVLDRGAWRHLWLVPLLMATSIGLSRSNGSGVWEALRGHKSPFLRTPKKGEVGSTSPATPAIRPEQSGGYLSQFTLSGETIEVVLGISYLIAALWCVQQQIYLALPFMVLFAIGFLYAGTWSMRERIALSLTAG